MDSTLFVLHFEHLLFNVALDQFRFRRYFGCCFFETNFQSFSPNFMAAAISAF